MSVNPNDPLISDANLDGSLSEADDGSDESSEALFKARVAEYRDESLHHPHTLLALLGDRNAGLFEFAHHFENRLKNDIATCEGDLHEVPGAGWMIATHNNFNKQITGYTNVILKVEEQVRQAEGGPLNRRSHSNRNKFRP